LEWLQGPSTAKMLHCSTPCAHGHGTVPELGIGIPRRQGLDVDETSWQEGENKKAVTSPLVLS